MYYVDDKEVMQRLDFFPVLLSGLEKAARKRKQLEENQSDQQLLIALAEERLLHLAIEAVTDIGSFIIDGLMLREASSYEDIIVVLQGENVFPEETANVLIPLVKLRRSLVQEYFLLDRTVECNLLDQLPEALTAFKNGVQAFLDKERF